MIMLSRVAKLRGQYRHHGKSLRATLSRSALDLATARKKAKAPQAKLLRGKTCQDGMPRSQEGQEFAPIRL
jgi:hypothetical protein